MMDIRFILVDPSHPGNIGAAARAMKNMALEDLVLVNPRQFPHPQATARASGAQSVLDSARVVATVAQAVEGCGFIAATTSRERDQNFRVLDARTAATRLVEAARRGPVAVLFGAERMGLTNPELESSHVLVSIPADQAYASLNLAMAVQIIAYELYLARTETVGAQSVPLTTAAPLATPEEMARLYAHLAEVMEEVGFRDRTQSGTNLMARIRRVLQRAELDRNEANIVRGFLTAVQNRRRRASEARHR